MTSILDGLGGDLMVRIQNAGTLMPHTPGLLGFMPHGHCYFWNPTMLRLQTFSDGLIAAAYFCIPFALVTFMRKRKDLAYPWMFLLFAAFILTCGLTHLMEVYTVFVPAYWLSGVIKALTALVSVATAILLVKLMPRALALPSPDQLRLANDELRNVNMALHESEERYRTMVDGVQDYAIFALDALGHVASWNSGAERIKGYGAGEIIGRHFSCFYTPLQIQEGLPESGLQAAAQDGRFEIEGERVRKDGSRFWASVVINALRDEAGNLRGYTKVTRDITARKQSEQALRVAHEEATAAILERISDGFVTFDRDWRCLCVNSAAARVFRKPREELLGKVLWDVFPEASRLLFGKEYRRAMEENVAIRVEDFYPEPVSAWFEMRCYPSSDGLSVFFSDITERRATEQRLRQLSRAVEQSPSSVVITDTKGNIEYINPKFTEITGYTPEDLYGKTPRILKSGAHPPEAYTEMWKTICAGREWRGEFYNKKKNGAFFWESASICPIIDENGVVTHFLGVKEDITERKNAELALLDAKFTAERANQAKDDFIAALSHELRTPLTPVLLTASALQDEEGLGPELRSQINLIRHNVQLEARLIDDLLDVSKIAHGKISLQPEAVDVSVLVAKAVEIMSEDLVRKDLMIDVESSAEHVNAYGDPARLQQLFWNLLRNAAKFTPSGGSIRVRTFNPDPRTLCAEVSDTGIGIESKYLETIFKPFDQGAASGDHRYGGLGLGLSISMAIAKLHGGTLSASSEGLNRGATFSVCLPISQTSQLAQPSPTTQPARKGGFFRILLVEDDENTRSVLSRLLTRDGHQVEAVGTYSAAIESAKSMANGETDRFEALISDIGLPDGSGLDIAREIKALSPDIKAIALSGYGTEVDILKSAHAGFGAHLTKPISFEELRRALAT